MSSHSYKYNLASRVSIVLTLLLTTLSSAFNPAVFHRLHHQSKTPARTLFATDTDNGTNSDVDSIHLQAVASAGLNTNELDVVLSAISTACNQEGISFITSSGADGRIESIGIQSTSKPAVPKSVPGATGRVVLLTAHGISLEDEGMMNDEDEWLLPIRYSISEQMDRVLYEDASNGLDQPVLVFLRPYHESLKIDNEEDAVAALMSVVEEEADEYDLCKPLLAEGDIKETNRAHSEAGRYLPSIHLEIDGAMVQNIDTLNTNWDTSTCSVLVFDDLVDDDLRQGLLDVVLGRWGEGDNQWDDIGNGPDPKRWVRGGLIDVPDDTSNVSHEEGVIDDVATTPCWGLSDEAVMDLCYNENASINELELRLTELFPQFTVSCLPEAVLGASVSPLTANAPTFGDTFDFHIDADPYQAPPSPWTDIYGRYPNRSIGKPRFVSCLIYLNDEWDDAFGAPTRFLDPPTEETHDVIPRPGRCVLMDQDCSHTVTAPTEAAGRRPRYSIVWKLILHPKLFGQDVMDLSGERSDWPKPTLVGSAAAYASSGEDI